MLLTEMLSGELHATLVAAERMAIDNANTKGDIPVDCRRTLCGGVLGIMKSGRKLAKAWGKRIVGEFGKVDL